MEIFGKETQCKLIIDRPTLRVDRKGKFRFNTQAAELMELSRGQRVLVAKDDDQWYVLLPGVDAEVYSSGIEIVGKSDKNPFYGLCFHSKYIANAFLNELKVADGHTFRLAMKPSVVNGIHAFAILTVELLKDIKAAAPYEQRVKETA